MHVKSSAKSAPAKARQDAEAEKALTSVGKPIESNMFSSDCQYSSGAA